MKLKYGPYSPSRLDTATCPYQFNEQYIKKRPCAKIEKLPQGRGSVVHEVFEQVTSKLISNKDYIFNPQEVRKWVVDSVNKHPVSYEELEVILGMVSKYIDRPPLNITEATEVERKLAVKLKLNEDGSIATFEDEIDGRIVTRWDFEECDYDDPNAFMRGRADILTISDDLTTLFVYDHKTQPNIEEADTFQMGVYAWVISKHYKFISEFQTTLHFARYGSYSEPYIWTKEDLYRIEEQLITRVEIIENRTVWTEAVPYKNCQYCPFVIECPTFREFVEIDKETGDYRLLYNNFHILGNVQRAVKLLELANVIDVAHSAIMSNIRPHVKEFGELAAAGKVWGYRGEEEVAWDLINKNEQKKLEHMEIISKHGELPHNYMGFSQTFTKSIWMSDKSAMLDELSKAAPRRTRVTFSGVKI